MPYSDMEARAAAAAAYILGARAVPRDLGGKSVRDFDLVFPGGTPEPLEITMAADQTTRHTWARLSQLDREAPTLTRAWTVSVPATVTVPSGRPEPFKARDFLATAEPLLRELEKAGVTEFDTARWVGIDAAALVVAQLVHLGCDLGTSGELADGEAGRIYLSSGVGGWVDPNSVACAVEREANKSDNIEKLREPPDARLRHLFVVIDGSSPALSPAYHGTLGRLPELPDPISTVWVAAGSAVHVTTPPADWTSHAVPDEVFEHPKRWIDVP